MKFEEQQWLVVIRVTLIDSANAPLEEGMVL